MPGAGGLSGSEYGSDAYTNAMRMMAMGQVLQGGSGGSYFNYMQQLAQSKAADARYAEQQAAASAAEAEQRAMLEQAQQGMAQYIASQTPNPVSAFNNNDPTGASVAADAMAYVKPELFPGLSQNTINSAARTNAPAASALIKMFYDMPDDMGGRTRASYEDGEATFAYNDQEAREYARENAPDYGYGFDDAGPDAKFEARQSMPTPMAPERMAQIMMNPMIPDEVKDDIMARFGTPESDMKWIDGVGMVDMNNPPEDLMAGQYQAEEEREIRNDANGVPRYVDTGEPVFPGAAGAEAGPNFEDEYKLRSQFEGIDTVQEFRAVQDSWVRVQRAADAALADNPAGDIGLIFSFMKMLDPGSVVREGEFATAENSAGVPERIRNLYNKVRNGDRLSPEQIHNFKNLAGDLYNGQLETFNSEVERFRGYATDYSLNPDRIATPGSAYNPIASSMPERFALNPGAAQLAKAKGVSVEELWESMSEEDRARWSN